jgi:hypothetical protein
MEFLNETKNEPIKCDVMRSCIACGSSTNKFKPKARKCTKCYSKINNEKYKKKDYFKQYYLDHKPPAPPSPKLQDLIIHNLTNTQVV